MIIKNKKNLRGKEKLGGIALFEILILIISIVAFSYFVGSEFRVVSAKLTGTDGGTTGGCNQANIPSQINIKGVARNGQDIIWTRVGNAGTLWKCVLNCQDKEGRDITGTTNYLCQTGYYSSSTLTASGLICDSNGVLCTKTTTARDTTAGSTVLPTPPLKLGGDKEKCPYECCQDDPDYENKLCIEPRPRCVNHKCYNDNEAQEKKAEIEKQKENLQKKYKSYEECIKAAKTDEEKKGCENAFPSQQQRGEGFLGLGTILGNIVEGAIWAVGVYIAARTILPMLGANENLVNAGSMALGLGVLAGKTAYGLFGGVKGGAGAIGRGIGVGVAVAVFVFVLMYKKEKQEVITFTCSPWQASTGGSHCEECNKQGILPCSEYQCRSLGQGCELLNKGTDQEKCVWVNKNDVEFPTIKPWEDALLKDYKYSPDNTISPPDRGVKIEYSAAASPYCVKAFTPLSFGVSLNEPAKCKIDTTGKKSFDEMRFFMSNGLLLYNHSYSLSLPGSAALASENITIQNDGEYKLYVRCQDANGNSNTANFVFKFCVEKGPDTTPPLIVSTSIPNKNPIAYNQTSVDVEVYVNEPSECKWSHLDQSYDDMEEEMDCSSGVFEMNAQMLYPCTTTLTGLKDRTDNNFYFRCKDSSDNVNTESYKYTLVGTQPLVIDWVKPNGTIKDSTDTVKVTLEAQTSAGYKDGEADCYYSETGNTGDYILFLNTHSYQHSQDLWLPEGSYEYYIKCIDLGGNTDVKTVDFNVETDSSPPIVTRAYHEETYLKLVTNEPARCVYDTKYENYPCDYAFEDGIEMTALDDVNHYTDWSTQSTLYIKCQDEFGNQPSPNECSIIVRPFSEYGQGNS